MKVSYNNIDMKVIHTRECSRVAVMSDDGTELLYMRYTYECVMIFNPADGATAYTGTNPPLATAGTFPSYTDNSIRYALLEPRKSLVISADEVGDNIVLQSPTPGFSVDANNGPVPIFCNVQSVTPRTWRVTWRVRTDIIECPELSSTTSPILSNRWSQVQSTGPDHRTTISTRGVTVFRTDLLTDMKRSSDDYRGQYIPGLPLNFQRSSVQVTLNSAGNVLAWEVVDQEQFAFIGATNDARRMGVVKFRDVFSTKSAPLDQVGVPSTFIIGQFDCTAWGDANSSIQGLFDWLARFAVERCAIPNGPVNPQINALILSVGTEESQVERKASLHVTIQIPPAKQGAAGLGTLRTDFIGIDIIRAFSNDGQSPQMPNDNNTRGTANSQMFANALKDACSAPFDPPAVAGYSVGSPSDNVLTTTTVVNVTVGQSPPASFTRYAQDATTAGVYTTMTVESKFSTNRGIIPCPVSGNSPSSSSDGGDDVVFIGVSRPMTTVEYWFEAERCSIPPLIPNPVVNDPNLVLLHDEVSPMAVALAPGDGTTPVYRIGGRYRYAMRKARKPADSIPFSVHPWTDFGYSDSTSQFDQSSFVHGIIDDQAGSSNPVPPYTPGAGI